jgi:triacylglycerol lipase
MNALLIRRRALAPLLAAALLAACASTPPPATPLPPIVFVHGNGDSAALWTPTVWRWESNGWPRERLYAVHFPYPLARDDNTLPQEGRSSTEDQRRFLAAEVDKVLAATGAPQVVLVGNSRGGNAIRDYIANGASPVGGGAAKVSHAILGGTPNHGVQADPTVNPNNEFNGAGPFLLGLNAPKGPNGDEVTPGVRWMTVRSDNNDKFAQPDGLWIGRKGKPTYVTFDGPALKGADNLVLPGRDHREVAYHPEAFAAAYRFVTGRAPANSAALYITPEARVVLNGQVGGYTAAGASNLPLVGAQVAVYAVNAATGARQGAALVDKTVGADGRWGPITTDAKTPLEFVVQAPGFAVSHVYRAAFLRSSDTVHLRPERLAAADKDGGEGADAVVSFIRPRAYFGNPRDSVLIDGQPAPGIPVGVAGVAASRVKRAAGRAVVGEFRSGVINERVVGQTWPAKDNQLTVLELQD